MGEQQEADAKENTYGRGSNHPEGDEVKKGANRKLRRGGALVAGFRKEARLLDRCIEEPCRIGGSGHTSRRELLRQLVEQLGCKYSAGHLATRPRNCLSDASHAMQPRPRRVCRRGWHALRL
jgi:hypothetical protein